MSVEIIRGKNVRVDDTVKIFGTGRITLRDNVQIRAFTVIEIDGELIIDELSVLGYHNFVQCSGIMKIGKGTLVGPNTVLLASAHQITTIPLIDEKMLKSSLIIKDNIWIGANCTINNNIVLEDNCIIGANSFVNKSVEKDAIVGGVPAKLIRYR